MTSSVLDFLNIWYHKGNIIKFVSCKSNTAVFHLILLLNNVHVLSRIEIQIKSFNMEFLDIQWYCNKLSFRYIS